MGQPGFGVMIGMLSGNASTVAAHQSREGKEIAGISLVDDRLRIRFTDGFTLVAADEGQSCCEHRYMTTDDKFEDFVGGTFIGMEIKEAPTISGEYDEHEIQFLEVKTSKGEFTMASHNEHNGYYGGFYIQLSLEQ